MANQSSAPPSSGRSLYANLLDPSKSAPGTISSAPVSYTNQQASTPEQDEAAKKQQALAASLRFQPTKRPQLAAQKARAKAAGIASRLSAIPNPAAVKSQLPSEVKQGEVQGEEFRPPPDSNHPSTNAPVKSTVADWMATASDDEDVNNFYAGSRQRGGRKKRKKNKAVTNTTQREEEEDWDAIYDPSKPININAYRGSSEQIRQTRLWKEKLYRSRMDKNKRRKTDDDSDLASMSDRSSEPARDRVLFTPSTCSQVNSHEGRFAPPTMSFAPPTQYDTNEPPANAEADADQEYIPPAASSTIPDDPSGEDAFARRMRMSQNQQPPPPPPPVGQISRSAVRYNLPAADPALPTTEEELADTMEMGQDDETTTGADEDQPRSLRPGQSGFAQRLLAKYGWEKGQGLGKEGTGITTALHAKVDKRKKKSDAEGGGFAQPAAIGRIVGGQKSQVGKDAEQGKFGAMSEVVRLEGMLKGMDLQAEMVHDQGGIMQEIGEECDVKYGKVERVFVHASTNNPAGAYVFVAFVQQLSALRAVNALDGRVFNGNEITARFWDKERFDKEDYE